MMHLYLGNRRDKTDEEQHLEWELEKEREQNRRYEEERLERDRQRREEIRQRVEYSYRQANTWPEALSNQSFLMHREAGYLVGVDEHAYYSQGSKACDRAIEIWPEEMAKVEEEIEALMKRANELLQGVAVAVGKRLVDEWEGEKKGDSWYGWNGIAKSLQNPDIDLDQWLNW